MANLYEITRTIESLLERAIGAGGEVLDEQLDAELDALNADRDKRALDIACAVIDYDAEGEKIEERAKELQAWAKSLYAKAERLRQYIAANVPEGHKVQDDRVRIGWRKSEACVLDVDVSMLPARFQRVSVAAAISELKDALKSGSEDAAKVAHLETRQHVQVK
jgi:hypothetical protein